MSYSVSVTRSGGGAVVVTRSDSGVKVVEANNVGTLVSVAQAAAASADEDAAAAAASALAASGSASAAASSATDAQTAQTAAELAETHAETAETNAETAQGLAEAAQAAAEAAQGAAEAAQVAAETAETNAETAETAAETAQGLAEAAQAAAEAAAASITLPLPIASGGTAATDAATARTNLTAAKSGANTDITSVALDNTGLTIKDSDSSHSLTIRQGSNQTAARTLTIQTGDTDRTLSINSNTTISGTTSGVNTGDQTITLTGDVTGTGTGSFAATIAAGAVTLAKMANIATDRLIGRDTAGTGVPEAITVSGGLEWTGGPGIQRSALTGDVTASAGSNATTIANDAVTYAKMQNISATSRVLGRKTASAGDTEECTLSEVLDFIGSAASGDVLYRGASTWARLPKGTDGQSLQLASGLPAWQWAEETHGFALSDETTAITTGTAKLTVRPWAYAFTISAVRASLATASSSGIPTVDINEGGTTILSTKLTIDANEKTSTTAATAAVISDTSIAADAEITFDIDVAGTGAKGLKVYITGRRT